MSNIYNPQSRDAGGYSFNGRTYAPPAPVRDFGPQRPIEGPSYSPQSQNTPNLQGTYNVPYPTRVGRVYNTGGIGLNVRSAANRSASRVTGLNDGATFNIIGENGDFYQTPQGYVSKQYVQDQGLAPTPQQVAQQNRVTVAPHPLAYNEQGPLAPGQTRDTGPIPVVSSPLPYPTVAPQPAPALPDNSGGYAGSYAGSYGGSYGGGSGGGTVSAAPLAIAPYSAPPPDRTALTSQYTKEGTDLFTPKYAALEENINVPYQTSLAQYEKSIADEKELQNQVLATEEAGFNRERARNPEDLRIALQTLAAQKGEEEQQTVFGRLRQLRGLYNEANQTGLVGSGIFGEQGYEQGQERSASASAAARQYQTAIAAKNLESTRGLEDITQNESEKQAATKLAISTYENTRLSQEDYRNTQHNNAIVALESEKGNNIRDYINGHLSDANAAFQSAQQAYYASHGQNY